MSWEYPEKYVTIYTDECSAYRRPILSQMWFPFAQKPKVFGGFRMNIPGRIIGGVNSVSGDLTFRIVKKTTVNELIKYYTMLPAHYPKAEKIFVILDNWPVHFHDKVLKAIEKYPTIEFIPLPTYAPWLNKIERLWLFMKKKISHMHPYGDSLKKHMNAIENVLTSLNDRKDFIIKYLGLCID